MASVIEVGEVYYPESDGKPMGETDEHREAMIRHIQILQQYYRGQQVYVSGDLLVYFEEGNPRKFVVPDAFVVKGIAPHRRRIYRTWIEGKAPDVVIETTSRKTCRKDTEEKPLIYARLRVKEYFLFDPDEEYLNPPLQGYRFTGDKYEPIAPSAAGCLVSQELGLRLCSVKNKLQFYRLDTGKRLRAPTERAAAEARRARAQAERADREAEARRAAEAENARLREELARRPTNP